MSFILPSFTRGQVNRAGIVLLNQGVSDQAKTDAIALINNWRACHAYPINTFQATLRARLKKVSDNPLVATRLKRLPSILRKLETNRGMQLARMQDVGGIRAIVDSVDQVKRLQDIYCDGRQSHILVNIDDYIEIPKISGYRSLHLIYRYKNVRVPDYNGLSLELQFRTRLQHAWATAVETIGIFLNQALKSSEGPAEWLDYFKVVSSAFALMEECPVGTEHSSWQPEKVYEMVVSLGEKLDVKRKLSAFSVVANAISTQRTGGSYHLIVLDAVEKTVSILSFGKQRLEEANAEYAKAERTAAAHPDMQTVLVTSSSIETLKRAFPNYFLDTKQFLDALTEIDESIS